MARDRIEALIGLKNESTDNGKEITRAYLKNSRSRPRARREPAKKRSMR
jgi:hypothetical protein